MDYTTFPPDTRNCPRCLELWNKVDGEAYYKHIWEHAPKPPKAEKVYAFTLTTNGNDIMKEQRELCYATQKLFNQQTVPITEGGAWLEYTEAGRPHIHGWYRTANEGRVFSKVFQRCWHLWKEKKGLTKFPGGYHEQMKTNRYIGYASAEGREVISKKLNEEVVINHDAYKLDRLSSIPLIYDGPNNETQATEEEENPAQTK